METSFSFRFQVMQMMFNWMLVTGIWNCAPKDYLEHPVESTLQQQELSKPMSVALIYTSSILYHTVLYFWNPGKTRRLKIYHIVSILMCTALFQSGWLVSAMLSLFVTYIISIMEYMHSVPHIKTELLLAHSVYKAHHITAITLLAFSWLYSLIPIGLFILFLHAGTDVCVFALRIVLKRSPHALKLYMLAAIVNLTWAYYRVYMMFLLTWKCFIAKSAFPAILGLFVLCACNLYYLYIIVTRTLHHLALW